VRLRRTNAAGTSDTLATFLAGVERTGTSTTQAPYFQRQATVQFVGQVASGDKVFPQVYIGGTSGTSPTQSIYSDPDSGTSNFFAIKLIGSALSPTAFTATPSCPSYARITLQLPQSTWSCSTCNAFSPNWLVSDLSYTSPTISAPSVPAGCTSPFRTFTASDGGVYITKVSMNRDMCTSPRLGVLTDWSVCSVALRAESIAGPQL
jgi:hypothetical protein